MDVDLMSKERSTVLIPRTKVTSKDSNAVPLNAAKHLIYTKFSVPVTIQYI